MLGIFSPRSRYRGQLLYHRGRSAAARAVGGLMARGWPYSSAFAHVRGWRSMGVGVWSADSDLAYSSGLLSRPS